MKCAYPGCRKHIEGDIEELLEKGWGFCPDRHLTDLPGFTKNHHFCECGAKSVNHPFHAPYCPEYERRSLPK